MIDKRLDNLRALLNEYGYAGYIVPSGDEYLSEYTPAHAKRLEYITGFTGSNGLAIILKTTVLFFTDGRYINQCFSQLDNTLFEIFDQQTLPDFPWKNYVKDDEIIAFDPKLFTTYKLRNLNKINLYSYTENLIDKIWQDQPSKPSSKIYEYPIKYSGQKYQDKIAKCRKVLEQNKATALIITDSDSVCWLYNIRAHDVEFSPLLLANAIITKDHAYLFTDKSRLEHLHRSDIAVIPERKFADIIQKISGLILFDETQCSSYIADLVKTKKYKHMKNPCMLWKACKNDIEINYMQEGHIQDAVAVCEMLALISKSAIDSFTEYSLGKKLTELRSKGKSYVFDSFPTICGYRENGAIIHYKAEIESAKKIEGEGILLIDSGGQYMGATTDITRTISIGPPTDDHKKYYTKVLKGHIALGKATFPQGRTTGAHLDILARQYLWNDGVDYAHGTGHGVGNFLSVHEGPQNISLMGFETKIAKGMVMSNEPGYYVPGQFGIRIENMMYTKEINSGFLKFEMLTLVPYAKDLIDFDMLIESEIDYLKAYYLDIKHKIFPLLSDSAKEWLEQEIQLKAS